MVGNRGGRTDVMSIISAGTGLIVNQLVRDANLNKRNFRKNIIHYLNEGRGKDVQHYLDTVANVSFSNKICHHIIRWWLFVYKLQSLY